MANFCLLPEKVNEFKKALKTKEITVPGLLNMTSEQRTDLLRTYAGDAAPQVNLLFEEKLVLKNRMLGIKNWASKMGEVGKYSPEGKAELAKKVSEYRAKQQERIFSPQENEQFLSSLAEKELGTHITKEEATKVFALSKRASDTLQKYDSEARTWASPEDKAAYGASKVLYEKYVDSLKGEEASLKEMVQGKIKEFKATAEENKAGAVLDLGKDALKELVNNSIGLVASVDNSFLGRQGYKTLITRPSAWYPGALKSFSDFAKTLKNGDNGAIDALMADVYSDPEFISGEYQKAGILPKKEEQFPTSLPEKIPVLGRVFKASELSFKGSGIRMRTQLYKLLANNARGQGVEMSDLQIKDIGKVVNSATARGSGKITENELVKAVLWSPRMLKANWDTLTGHTLGAGLKTPFARKEAFKNWAKVVGFIGTILLINKAVNKDSELNPLSSNFGKIVVNDTKIARVLSVLGDFVGISSNTRDGKTKFDVTAGMASLITVFARQIRNRSKSATTGITTKFGPGFADNTRFDAFIDFLVGKTNPIAKSLIDVGREKDFEGHKPTVLSTLEGIGVPISIQNILGLNKNTGGVDWNLDPGKELTQFRDKIGKDKFNEANDKFNATFIKRLEDLKNDVPNFKSQDDEGKQKAVTKLKDEIKNQIFKEYGFKYKK